MFMALGANMFKALGANMFRALGVNMFQGFLVVVVVVLAGLGGFTGAEPFLQIQDLLLPCTKINKI
jgi:hypothetical protein